MSKKITLKYIAEHFNVSTSTVSMALKDSYEISEAMRTKIQNFAKAHNYRPNPFALNLKQKTTKTIGVIIPTILNHFFVQIFSGIERVAHESGYNLITVITQGNLNKEIDTVNMFKDGFIDGILISISEETQSKQYFKHLHDFSNEAGPIVMFDRVSDLLQCDKIIVDDYNCAYNATNYLLKTGCKNIAIVSVLDHLGIVELRINGYKKALHDNNIEVNEKLITLVKKEYDFETEIKTLLDYQDVDAIIGLEEFSTIESMIIAESRGYKIPDDISFIGYTNGNLFKYVKPSVTCINQHGEYMGRVATEKLITRIEQEESNLHYETKIIKTSLVLRNSTKAVII
ncbi:LacI family DNA-binding transcriptional regulator [Aestuariivivens sediminis]|uniref:LacI family DNA-binding transcriptional regulator n=1 Tax=Aestuariivivens sediminis TaxID=2913557 RepID=UPI001F5A518B|nr:LacI family DNA-binding transcriptional regulator [Aestuariivivens sediminis]